MLGMTRLAHIVLLAAFTTLFAGCGPQDPQDTDQVIPDQTATEQQGLKWTPTPQVPYPCPDGHGHWCVCSGDVMDCRAVKY